MLFLINLLLIIFILYLREIYAAHSLLLERSSPIHYGLRLSRSQSDKFYVDSLLVSRLRNKFEPKIVADTFRKERTLSNMTTTYSHENLIRTDVAMDSIISFWIRRELLQYEGEILSHISFCILLYNQSETTRLNNPSRHCITI